MPDEIPWDAKGWIGSKAYISQQAFREVQEDLPEILIKMDFSFDQIDYEKGLKVLFYQFSYLALELLALQIPHLLIFNREVQTKIAEQVKSFYQFLQKYDELKPVFYVSPRYTYEYSIQDKKNLYVILFGEVFRRGKRTQATPDDTFLKLIFIHDALYHSSLELQDKNLEQATQYLTKLWQEIGGEGDTTPPNLVETDLACPIIPEVGPDMRYTIEFLKLNRDVKAYTVPPEYAHRDYSPKAPHIARSKILHRQEEVEVEYQMQINKVFPLEILEKLLDFYEVYLQESLPAIRRKINYTQVKALLDAYRFLFRNYYYQIYYRIEYSTLRLEFLRAKLEVSALEGLILDARQSDPEDYPSLDHIQRHPILKRDQYAYINGAFLLESFFCQMDHLFKSTPFRDFKGSIMERAVSSVLRKYGILPYNILLSNHPAADSNPAYLDTLVRRTNPIGAPYDRLYEPPELIHLQYTDAPFFEGHTFAEFDICFVHGDTLYILECKNTPIYSRRDRTDTTLYDIIRMMTLGYKMCAYFKVPLVHKALEEQLGTFSKMRSFIITPYPTPLTIGMNYLGHFLEKLGYKLDTAAMDRMWETVFEIFGPDAALFREKK